MYPNKPKTRIMNRSGYSLLEMLGYVAVLAIGINLCGSLLISGHRVTAVVTEKMDNIHGIEEAEALFRDAVRSADTVVESIGGYRTGENVLILSATEPDGRIRYIVAGNIMDKNCFSRIDFFEKEEGQDLDFMKTAGQMLEYCRFSIDKSGGIPVIRASLKRKAEPGEDPGRLMEHHFIASPRGIASEKLSRDLEDHS